MTSSDVNEDVQIEVVENYFHQISDSSSITPVYSTHDSDDDHLPNYEGILVKKLSKINNGIYIIVRHW